MAEVVLNEMGKVYDDGTRAVDRLSLEIPDGEFLVLVGPSGCGKTTALRMVAGLEDVTEGSLRIGDRIVNKVPARDRDVAMVFQSYALYPHLNVFENIAFGLRLRHAPRAEIGRRVEGAADFLGLREHLHRRPGSLSGGQRQRVAVGRAMVREPAVFLMDEPLSNLDAKLRVQMRAEIARTTRRLGVTTIYVTHDQTEAMTLGSRVAVLKRGVLQQVATPRELYDRPENLFVAGFIGSPAMNLVHGVFTVRDGKDTLLLGAKALPVDAALFAARPGLHAYRDRLVAVGVRPEDMEDVSVLPAPSAAVLQANAELTEALGSDLLVHFTIQAAAVVTDDVRELARDAGIEPAAPGTEWTELVARFNPRSSVRDGDSVQVAVDTARLHAFDLETGQSIW